MSKKSPLPVSELDKATRQELERICAMEPGHLTNTERAFMRGRQDYLTADQIEDYCTEVDEEETEEEVTEEEETDTEDGEESQDDYDSMTVAQLKEELEARGLPSTGKKPELVAALEANDNE